MKKTKGLLFIGVLGTLILSGCSLPELNFSLPDLSELTKQSEAKDSKQESSSSAKQESSSSSKKESSSSKITSSSSKTQSSKTPISSSEKLEPALSWENFNFEEINGNYYIVISGKLLNIDLNDANFAFGLKYSSNYSSGAGNNEGEWVVGSVNPAVSDYHYVPEIHWDGHFEVRIPLKNILWQPGEYEVYAGPRNLYSRVETSLWNGGLSEFNANGNKILINPDLSLITAEELPPLLFTESTVIVEEDKAILKIGGELGSATAAEFEALPIKVLCERQVGGWKQFNMGAEKVTKVVEGTKGYVKIDVTELEVGGYQVKIGFDDEFAPYTEMECDSYDKRNEPTVFGGKEYAPYFQAGGNSAETLYGCCGLYIDNAAIVITEATTRFEAESLPASSVTIEEKTEGDETVSGTGYAKEMTKTSGWWGRAGQLDAVIKLAAAGTYKVKVAYRSANATEAGAFELTVDGDSNGDKGAAAAEWTVFESDAFDLAAGKHTISVKGISNVKTDVDYIELVRQEEPIILEAEEAELGGAAQVEYKDGASGGQSVGYLSEGASITFTATVAAAGAYSFKMNCGSVNANWSSWPNVTAEEQVLTDELMPVTVNGVPHSVNGITVPGGNVSPTADWFLVDLGDVTLNAGANTIVFSFTAQGPNIDYIMLQKIA